MKIKATGVMAKYLQELLPDYRIELRKLDQHNYKMMVDYDLYRAEDHGDYDYNTGLYKAIRVEYPAEYYAMPRWISTYELLQAFKHAGPDVTIEQANNILKEAIQI